MTTAIDIAQELARARDERDAERLARVRAEAELEGYRKAMREALTVVVSARRQDDAGEEPARSSAADRAKAYRARMKAAQPTGQRDAVTPVTSRVTERVTNRDDRHARHVTRHAPEEDMNASPSPLVPPPLSPDPSLSSPLYPPSLSKNPLKSPEGDAPVVDGEARAVELDQVPAPRRQRQAGTKAKDPGSSAPPAAQPSPAVSEARDGEGLLAFEAGAAPGEDLPSQLGETFRAVMGSSYRWDMRRDERATNELLAAAAEAGPAEVLRRWRIGLENKGFPRVRSLSDLVKRWNDCAQPAGGGAPAAPARPPDGLAQGRTGCCERCGRAGQGAEYGGGTSGAVWLGYQCGCGSAWGDEVKRGRPYTEAAAWAREGRAGRVAT